MRDEANKPFEQINRGYNETFQNGRLSVGLVVPIAQYGQSPVPDMANHLSGIQQAEKLGFKAVWLRDVPFNVPSFGDAGQLFDRTWFFGCRFGIRGDGCFRFLSIVRFRFFRFGFCQLPVACFDGRIIGAQVGMTAVDKARGYFAAPASAGQ